MRLCRFVHQGEPRIGFHLGERVLPLDVAAASWRESTEGDETLADSLLGTLLGTSDLIDFLPPDGPAFPTTRRIAAWVDANPSAVDASAIPGQSLALLAPIPRPPKLLFLAGNYSKHIEEGGGTAVERDATFPYVFMKPPTTTINHPGADVAIPSVSPAHIDWELELGVVIGREAKGVQEADALEYVAGYTVVNDISDRRFRPNPDRHERPKDSFFDWLHGKWHDGFCPMGPCVVSSDVVPDPQKFPLELRVNGELRQDSSTAYQIFSVAAVIEFVSSFVTLEPGDVISTGTPAGVGNTTKTYLKPGDKLEATIDGIGTLVNQVVASKD
jgi:2-keto-4-pentenoate hydratase/2-oxohepta-3-ene-1,7-dioic acid hydratase in catechol pathway